MFSFQEFLQILSCKQSPFLFKLYIQEHSIAFAFFPWACSKPISISKLDFLSGSPLSLKISRILIFRPSVWPMQNSSSLVNWLSYKFMSVKSRCLTEPLNILSGQSVGSISLGPYPSPKYPKCLHDLVCPSFFIEDPFTSYSSVIDPFPYIKLSGSFSGDGGCRIVSGSNEDTRVVFSLLRADLLNFSASTSWGLASTVSKHSTSCLSGVSITFCWKFTNPFSLYFICIDFFFLKVCF